MLSPKEIQVLKIMCSSEKALKNSEIAEHGFSLNTVNVVIKKLQLKGLIEVKEIVRSGTVLCRAWSPSANVKSKVVDMILNEYHQIITPQELMDILVNSK